MGRGGKDQRGAKWDAGCGTTVLGRHHTMNGARTTPGKATRDFDTGMDKRVKQNSKERKKANIAIWHTTGKAGYRTAVSVEGRGEKMERNIKSRNHCWFPNVDIIWKLLKWVLHVRRTEEPLRAGRLVHHPPFQLTALAQRPGAATVKGK